MIRIDNTRFGTIEIEEASVMHFSEGLVGFPNEKRFALIHNANEPIAHLQSLDTPAIALPVVDRHLFGKEYPSPGPAELARSAGLGGDDFIVLVPISKKNQNVRANMLAPIIVNAGNRQAAQVVLDPQRYSTHAPIQ
jgi:flagellar assembly factor FliW